MLRKKNTKILFGVILRCGYRYDFILKNTIQRQSFIIIEIIYAFNTVHIQCENRKLTSFTSVVFFLAVEISFSRKFFYIHNYHFNLLNDSTRMSVFYVSLQNREILNCQYLKNSRF